jgi:hypothetical protein
LKYQQDKKPICYKVWLDFWLHTWNLHWEGG